MELRPEVEDRSGVDPQAAYRCTDEDCGRTSLGKDLLPIIYRPSKEVDGKIVDDESLPRQCNIRRCPYCRGTVEIIERGGCIA